MFIVIFFINVIILTIIKLYLVKKLPITSSYSKRTFKGLVGLGLTMGLSGVLGSILNLLRSKDINDLNKNTNSLYSNFSASTPIDKKIGVIERFNYLIILLFGVAVSILSYRMIQFSLLIPLKTVLNSLAYILLGFNITDYIDTMTELYLPLIKQWLNVNLSSIFNFELPSNLPTGWSPDDLEVVKVLRTGGDIIHEIRNLTSEPVSDMLDGSAEELKSHPFRGADWGDARVNYDRGPRASNSWVDFEESEGSSVNYKYILGGLLLVVIGLAVYVYYGETISDYFSGNSSGNSSGKPGGKPNTGGNPEALRGSHGLRDPHSLRKPEIKLRINDGDSYLNRLKSWFFDGKPTFKGHSKSNVVFNGNGYTQYDIKWYWDRTHQRWLPSPPNFNFVPRHPLLQMITEPSPTGSVASTITLKPQSESVVLKAQSESVIGSHDKGSPVKGSPVKGSPKATDSPIHSPNSPNSSKGSSSSSSSGSSTGLPSKSGFVENKAKLNENLSKYLPEVSSSSSKVLSDFAKSTQSGLNTNHDLILPEADPRLNPFITSRHGRVPVGLKLNVEGSVTSTVTSPIKTGDVTSKLMGDYLSPDWTPRNLRTPVTPTSRTPVSTPVSVGEGLKSFAEEQGVRVRGSSPMPSPLRVGQGNFNWSKSVTEKLESIKGLISPAAESGLSPTVEHNVVE